MWNVLGNEEKEYVKEFALMELTYETAEATIDAAVILARKVYAVVRSRDEPKWILGRDGDGFFPASVFD